MVLTLSPDSRATFTKLTPRFDVAGTEGTGDVVCEAWPNSALRDAEAASAKTFSSVSTSAERLRDCKNVRRDENKSVVPSRTGQLFGPVLDSALRCPTLGL